MASLFCTECGSKNLYTLNKPKFCQSCGHPTGGVVAKAKLNTLQRQPVVRHEVEEEYEEETFRSLSKLDYEVEYNKSNITLGDVLNNPMNPEDVQYNSNKIKGYKKMSKEEFLNQSTAECGPSRPKDIDGE